MLYLDLLLHTLPEIGFAHHFYAENYRQSYGIPDSSFEIVYIKAGTLSIELDGNVLSAPPGSILILCRHLPVRLEVVDNTRHSHCSIQLRCRYSAHVRSSADGQETHPGLLLPMVIPPSGKTEQIGRSLQSIIARMQVSREANAHNCTLGIMGILAELDSTCREQISTALPSDQLLCSKLKAWIDSHIQESFTLEQLASILGRSPNYLNALFKQVNGISIRQYINRKKAELIAELMIHKSAAFRTACENVGITDIAYGYRLFKKQMGTTPQQYIAAVYPQKGEN